MEKGRYVDEFHGGANSRIKAKQRVAQLDALLMAGGFILKKWVSNNPAILEDIPPDRKITFFKTIRTTRFFDPLGFLSPITVAGKIFIQELWLSKLDWDEDLPDNLAKKWITFTNQLKDMPKFEIPRWIGDASQKAMAAVVFLCFLLLYSLMVRLGFFHCFQTKVFIFLGIDSEVAKKWIEGHPSKWKDFVQNRVSLIQQALPQAIWRFVPGNENPADLATRGLTPLQLSESKEWWQGPQWLSLNPVMWPEESPHNITR
ncbi:uncharacterized protein [Temnothorax nylanderi]|uniref:uncharacterized protein n=1 Tax=Temnothorax nylanderi TaxID=102681 RepID=UPI003A88B796